MDFKEKIAAYLHEITTHSKQEILEKIEIPPDSKLGDFAVPCFLFAKLLKKSPQAIAQDLEKKLIEKNLAADHQFFDRIIATGPYINFFIVKSLFIKHHIHDILVHGNAYGKQEQQKTITLIESPGPNTNKPLHLGHLRNMLLGQSLANILKYNGKQVKIVNVVNDRGVHICKSMLAYEKLGNHSTPQEAGIKSDHFVGDYYVKYSQLEKENPDSEKEIQDMLVKWEHNDPHIRKLWELMNGWALSGFDETFKKLDFHIDKTYYESQTYLHGKDIILDALHKGIFEKDDTGAVIFNLQTKNLGKKVLLRGNGTSVYITQDIYMAKLRSEELKFNEMIYVVGNEQEHHFKVLFEIFKALDFPFAHHCRHFSYGMVELPEGKMKSREGNVMDTDELLEEVTLLAKEELKKRYETLTLPELDKRSKIIALSAIRFFFLKHDPLKNFVFNPKESLSFDGETGPYVEYTYARINSVFKKFAVQNSDESEKRSAYLLHAPLETLTESNEFELIKLLSGYSDIIKTSAQDLKPSTIARYLLDVSQAFNGFYHQNPILTAPKDVMAARLALCACVQHVLHSGLTLLNIEPIDEM